MISGRAHAYADEQGTLRPRCKAFVVEPTRGWSHAKLGPRTRDPAPESAGERALRDLVGPVGGTKAVTTPTHHVHTPPMHGRPINRGTHIEKRTRSDGRASWRALKVRRLDLTRGRAVFGGTSSATPQPRSPSPRAPTSRSCSRCSATPRRPSARHLRLPVRGPTRRGRRCHEQGPRSRRNRVATSSYGRTRRRPTAPRATPQRPRPRILWPIRVQRPGASCGARMRKPSDPQSCRSEGYPREYPRPDSNRRYRLERAAC